MHLCPHTFIAILHRKLSPLGMEYLQRNVRRCIYCLCMWCSLTYSERQENKTCTCWRIAVRTGSKHMPTERSSQTAGPATSLRVCVRERKKNTTKSALLIDARFELTGRHQTACMAGRSVAVSDSKSSSNATHPVFLRLHIQLVSNPGQRVDGFAQHWTVHTHTHIYNDSVITS